jgi:hypothetical protein
MAKKVDLTLATPQQVREIGAEINHLEGMLKADQSKPNPKIQDVEEFNSVIKKKKELLATHAPKPFRGKNKDKAAKRIKELDSFIKEHMPSEKDYYQKYPKGCDNNFERAVNRQVVFQTDPTIQKAIAERKYLWGRLEPDDPYKRNIEGLRKKNR